MLYNSYAFEAALRLTAINPINPRPIAAAIIPHSDKEPAYLNSKIDWGTLLHTGLTLLRYAKMAVRLM